MTKKNWNSPKVLVVDKKFIDIISKKVLTVESSLYASGCHQGMRTKY